MKITNNNIYKREKTYSTVSKGYIFKAKLIMQRENKQNKTKQKILTRKNALERKRYWVGIFELLIQSGIFPADVSRFFQQY